MTGGAELVASLAGDDLADLVARARAVAASTAAPESIELRLDGLPGALLADAARDAAALAPLAALAGDMPSKLLVACHGPEAFGGFEGPAGERLAVLRAAARQGVGRVDVHVDLAGELGPLPGRARVVLSDHELAGTPDDAVLGRRLSRLRARAGARERIKFVTHATCAEDGLRLLLAGARAPGERVFFCSGAAGSFTRLVAPVVGSAATYASAGPATAPGQLDVDAVRAAWPAVGISAATAVFAVVGSPVAHSRSPAAHGAAQRALGLNAVFAALEPRDFGACMALATRFAPLRGLAVTAPFKLAALAASTAAETVARRVGAANTLVRDGAGWFAANTDVAAVAALARGLVAGAGAALVLGAGGAARAAVVALDGAGWDVSIAARRIGAARALATELGVAVLPWEAVASFAADLVVQATPLGGPLDADGRPPLPRAPDAALIEANYGAGPTPLERDARGVGRPVAGGADWFAAQAEAQFALFHGVRPPAMRPLG